MRVPSSRLLPLAALLGLGLVPACGPDAQPAPVTPPPPPSASVVATPPPPPGPPAKNVSLADVGLDASAMDRGADPCADFYSFACGNWIKKTEIPSDKARWSRFSEIAERNEKELRRILDEATKNASDPVAKKVGGFYGACMDEAAVEAAGTKALDPLRAIVRKVRDKKTLGAAITELHKHRVWALFDISDDQDFKDATRVIATLDQSGLGLPDRDYYVKDDEKSVGLRKKYVEHVEKMLTLSGYKPKDAKAAAADVMEIETALAKASKTRVERRDPKGLYNKIDRAGLAKTAPTFPWDAYFEGLGFPGIKDVNVTSVPFFEGLEKLLSSTKPAAWHRYLDWHIVRWTANALPKAFTDEAFQMEQALTGQATQRDRWKRCVEATDGALGELLAQPFIQKNFGKDQKEAVETMVFAIRDAFGEEVKKLDWMDEKTKEKALAKLKAMAYLIGYPPKWRSYDFDVEPKAYTKAALAARAFEMKRRLSKVGKPLDREEWQMTPPTVNAYYDPLKNHMVFPAGILRSPFYAPGASVAVNAGGIGMVVGHELTHGFDDEGSQFAGNGNLENWWEADVRGKFEAKAACVDAQYGSYESLPGVKLNGKLTLGENIADIGGIKLAFRAYRALRANAKEALVAEGFNEDQQFFLSVGQTWCSKAKDEWARMAAQVDPHSPPRFRVNGSLSDTPEFAKAFSCARGTAMNPDKACVVW